MSADNLVELFGPAHPVEVPETASGEARFWAGAIRALVSRRSWATTEDIAANLGALQEIADCLDMMAADLEVEETHSLVALDPVPPPPPTPAPTTYEEAARLRDELETDRG